MNLYETFTLLGIVLSPISAVAITLFYERHRRQRDSRMQVLRQLLSTYRLAGDPAWTVGVNMTLIEFRKVKRVRDARKDYVEIASHRPQKGDEESHGKTLAAKQTALVYEVARALGFDITEGELTTQSYVAGGWLNRDNLYLDSLLAMREVANATQKSADIAERMLGVISTPPPSSV